MPLYPSYTPTTIFGAAGVARAQYAIVSPDGVPLGPTGSIANGANRGMGTHVMVKRAAGTAPTPREVNVTGDNGRKKLKFVFTAAEIGSFDMDFGAFDMNAYAAFTGTKIQTIGDWAMVGQQTDQAPNSVQICLLFNIDIEDADAGNFGQARWYNLFIPLANVYPLGSEHVEAQDGQFKYRVSPVQAGQTPWREAFTNAKNGFTKAAAFGITSRNPLTMNTFVSDGSTQSFLLDYRPTEDATGNAVKVWRNAGSEISVTNVVIATKSVTIASTGTAGDTNVVVHEAEAEDLLV